MNTRLRTLALALACLLGACGDKQPDMQPVNQEALDALARELQVTYTVLDNRAGPHCDSRFAGGECFRAQLTLTLPGAFDYGGWSIYFSQLTPIQEVESDEFAVEHINGDLHRLTPTDDFEGFRPGESKTIAFVAGAEQLTVTDMMPNYYIAAPGLKPALIESTEPHIDPHTGLEELPFATPLTFEDRHFKRTPDDLTQPATAGHLFDENRRAYADGMRVSTAQIANAIIPTPREVLLDPRAGRVDLSGGIRPHYTNLTRREVAAALRRLSRFGIEETATGVPLKMRVVPGSRAAGAYTLSIAQESIRITAGDAAGAANALRSLASLLVPGDATVAAMTVEDAPRYPFRGMHVDVARNFHGKRFMLSLLERMAELKLNRLHLHLADDEGWRLAIPGLPELTEVGARRCHDLEEERCLLPQLGSGPDANAAVNGYYTREDYLALLRAAAARHIQVIPSFDMPGHARAAVVSMEARHRRLMRAGDPEAARAYLLSDTEDRTGYRSVQHYSDNTINVCMESSYAFVGKVVGELQAMHREAGHPLTRFHIGADETPGAWAESPVCRQFLADNSAGIDEAGQLGGYFVERVAAMLADMGIEAAGWSDGLGRARAGRMPKNVQANAWIPLYHGGHRDAHALANRGWEVVLSLPEVLYFDAPYQPDPQERGNDWATRGTDTRQVFEFMPDNLPAHAEVWTDLQNRPMTIDDRVQTDEQGNVVHRPLAENAGFAGIQGQLWSEMVRRDDQAEYMIFPRLAALAERAWHRADWEPPYDSEGRLYGPNTRHFSDEMRQRRDRDWARFARVLAAKQLPKWDRARIAYRIPTVGARLIDGQLHANVSLPGLPIEYRVDGGEWQRYRRPVAVAGQVEVRALSARGRRPGRAIVID